MVSAAKDRWACHLSMQRCSLTFFLLFSLRWTKPPCANGGFGFRMILGVNAGIDETSLQVTQFLFNKSLLSRGEEARVHVTQAKGGLNRDPALAINQVRPGILDRLDDIRLDSHHPASRPLFRRNRPDHGCARRPDVGGKIR